MQLSIVSSYLNVNLPIILDGIITYTITCLNIWYYTFLFLLLLTHVLLVHYWLFLNVFALSFVVILPSCYRKLRIIFLFSNKFQYFSSYSQYLRNKKMAYYYPLNDSTNNITLLNISYLFFYEFKSTSFYGQTISMPSSFLALERKFVIHCTMFKVGINCNTFLCNLYLFSQN